jgi:cation:H+ antiporter
MLGSPGVAVGNIVGSNIANVLLILGLASLIYPIRVASRALQRDGMLVLVTAIAFALIGYFLALDRVVGAIFLTVLAAYILMAYQQERADQAEAGHSAAFEKGRSYEELHDIDPPQKFAEQHQTEPKRHVLFSLGLAAVGLLLVIGGGNLVVVGAISFARSAGVSETVIGLTVVALGTALPEFVTSLVAALRRHSDIALGNILGSNIYNILGIGGATALIAPTAIPQEIVRFDNVVMIAASLALLVFARSGYRIGRLEGAGLLAAYAVYLFVLWPR